MKAGFLLLLGLILSLKANGADRPPSPTGWQSNVVFTDYSPYSRDAEMLRRLLSPLVLWRGRQAEKGVTVREQDIDLAQERFTLYVPDAAPPGGYGLLVFVVPWAEAAVPRQWKRGLDRHGMILVTPANAENAASVVGRRIPLALLAAQNVMNRYKIDPERVYVGGLSGGSRVAESVALAYPDLFRGALLEAGADPLPGHFAIPPADLFRRFQDSMRIVYFTGENDDSNRGTDAISRRSMEDWCVFDIDSLKIPNAQHIAADPGSFSEALTELARHAPADRERVDSCRAKIDAEMNAGLQQAQALLTGGKADEARASLNKIDLRYGGLAAPRSIELAKKLDAVH
jgi:hypothetical protein